MITPTSATPAGDISGDWDKAYAAELKAGKNPPEASCEATNNIAKKYSMAYYEGQISAPGPNGWCLTSSPENAFFKGIGHLANSIHVNEFNESRNAGKFSCRQYQGVGWEESGNLGLNYYQRESIQAGVRI